MLIDLFKKIRIIRKPFSGIKLTIDEAVIDEILNQIDNNNINVIPDCFWILLSDNSRIKERIVQSLTNLVNSLTGSQLVQLDSIFRERTSLDWTYDWSRENPERFLNSEMCVQEKVVILGLASFHPNGYFREKAINTLSSLETGLELPFLFIRLNDWVEEVRLATKKAIIKRINSENAKEIVNCLPLIFHLKQCKRDNHDQIIKMVLSCLASPEAKNEVINGFGHHDPKVRSLCFEIAFEAGFIDKKTIDKKTIIRYLMKEPLSYIRSRTFQKIQASINYEEFQEIKQWLLNEKSSSLKVLGLEMFYKFAPSECIEELENAVLDESLQVRETARFLLRKLNQFDFPSFYRSSILKSEKLYGAIMGLGEVGGASDVILIERFLDADKPQLVRATMRSLAKLDFAKYKGHFISLLLDLRPGISKEAKKLLIKNITKSDAEIIHQTYLESNQLHIKKNCAVLLCSIGKWDSLGYILEFCASSNDKIKQIGNLELTKWIMGYNRSFTSPNKEQLAFINQAINKFGNSLQEREREFIEFNLKK